MINSMTNGEILLLTETKINLNIKLNELNMRWIIERKNRKI
jgi:hypothetical protein